MRINKNRFMKVILLLFMSIFLIGCQTLKATYKNKKVCPKCHTTTSISFYEDEDHDIAPSFKDIKVKCPTCGKTSTVNEVLRSENQIHVCSSCSVMVQECPVCKLRVDTD